MKMHLALLMAATIAFSAHADDDDKGFGAAGVLSNKNSEDYQRQRYRLVSLCLKTRN